ncbi:hypothetical protein [Lachnotalea glycerini]|uniref:Uncharacterized protein n=1 Tax=Lachnotalea glycerini TaxID=1763509 RepID=A0A371JKF7_9FIRM|nr:hypothetical protein [Lachnotalea glycerini]RDY33216.1 hypothetical protein CG710_001450 [Lachnotalea glycerini]
MIYYIYIIMEMMLLGLGLGQSDFFINLGFLGFVLSMMGISLLNIILIINIGNIFRYIYSVKKHISYFPLYLCPFIITSISEKHIKIKYIGIKKDFFRVILPKEIIEDIFTSNDNHDIKNDRIVLIKKSIQIQIVGRYLGIIVITLVEAITLHSISICMYGIGLIVIQRALSDWSSIDYYVGEAWIQKSFDKPSDKFIDYCASQISYHDTEYNVLYKVYQENLLSRDNLFSIDWCSYNLMHMYILEYSKKIAFTQEFITHLQHQINQIDSIQVSSYQWYGFVTNLYWEILTNRENTVKSFISIIESVKNSYEIVPVKIRRILPLKIFDWYLDLAKCHKIGRKNSGKPKYRILMRDSLCVISAEYFSCYRKFEQEIEKEMS